ncbi:MAG: type III-A CRISPR-associated protein Csm2, partial [Fimbriimonadales bacterium]|nr:type III-A CRISPR-associated protein Csm2 [Fimbriimonadales bacterium]
AQHRPQHRYDQIIETSKEYYEHGKDVLAKQVFSDWPRELADLFRGRVRRTALRKFYDQVVTARLLLKAKPNEKERILRSAMGNIIRHAEYQNSRGVLSKEAAKFLSKHAKHVDTDERLFEGFFQLFQSLMAYLPR